jgi:L-fuculose-phosphate aldolase
MRSEPDYKNDIITVGKMLHSKGYIAATDGNISIKISPDRILTTASGVSKGFLKDEHIVVVDGDGELLFGNYKPSSELKMHIAAYKLRPELRAIVHGHPPTCTAFTIAGISLAKCILPEVVMTLGVIPTAGYATPTTGEVPDSIKDYIAKYDAIILDRHGAITVSKTDVFDAYYKLEKIEHTAKITLKARQLGKVKTLNEEQIVKLTDVSGIAREKLCPSTCVNCGACSASGNKKDASPNKEETATLEELIREEVMAEVKKLVN